MSESPRADAGPGGRVLVCGAGYVGGALARELSEAGQAVVALRRRTPERPTPGVLSIAADVTSPASLGAIPDDVTRAVYAVSPSARTEAAYEDAYVRGLENLLGGLSRRGVQLGRLVLTSSTAVYAQDDGGWVDEASPTQPWSFSGRTLLRGEGVARAAGGVVLRLAGIYGPGRTWLVRRVASGEARVDDGPAPARAPRYGNRIHQDDCAGALRHLLALPSPPPVLIGVDDDPAPLADVYRFVAARLGCPPPPPGASGEGRGGNKRASNARLRASGYALRVPSYREGYPAIVERYLAEV